MKQATLARLNALLPADNSVWNLTDEENAKMTGIAQRLIDRLEIHIQREDYSTVSGHHAGVTRRMELIESFVHQYFSRFDRDQDANLQPSSRDSAFNFATEVAVAVGIPVQALDQSWNRIQEVANMMTPDGAF